MSLNKVVDVSTNVFLILSVEHGFLWLFAMGILSTG